jgi:hypothetical protein
MSLLSRAGAIALAFSLLVAGPVAAATKSGRARMAVHWLSHQQNDDGSFPGFSTIGSTADAVVAFSAAERSPDDIAEALDFLRTNEADVDSIGEIAKVVMALEAGGANPRDFAGRDLVQEILDSRQPTGRFGATTEVLNHALAMIALKAAGVERTEAEVDWLLSAQCDDGGWQFDEPPGLRDNSHCQSPDGDFFVSETDATAYAVIALAGEKRWSRTAPKSPFRFFKVRRDRVKKGWGYDLTYPITSSNSTALVIEAYRTHDKSLPDGATKALIKLQYRLCGERAGAFAFSYENVDGKWQRQDPDVGATIGSILGLVPRPYDAPPEITKPPPEPESC